MFRLQEPKNESFKFRTPDRQDRSILDSYARNSKSGPEKWWELHIMITNLAILTS